MSEMPSRETVDAQQRRRTGLALFAVLLAIALGVAVMATVVVDQLVLPAPATPNGAIGTGVLPN